MLDIMPTRNIIDKNIKIMGKVKKKMKRRKEWKNQFIIPNSTPTNFQDMFITIPFIVKWFKLDIVETRAFLVIDTKYSKK